MNLGEYLDHLANKLWVFWFFVFGGVVNVVDSVRFRERHGCLVAVVHVLLGDGVVRFEQESVVDGSSSSSERRFRSSACGGTVGGLTTVSAGAHRGLEDEEVGFGDLERVESSLETVTAAAAIQFREDETVHWTSLAQQL